MTLDVDIQQLNLECIAYKVCRDENWLLEKVDRVEHEYRAFLQIIKNYGSSDTIAPTKDIDIFWHYHILDTMKYIEDCNALFGFYLHHYPYSGVFGENDAKKQNQRVTNTIQLIRKYIAQGD